MQLVIPNLGDGIENAQVISIMAKPGEKVTKEQTLLELETDKAVAPVPCPEDGVIGSISVAEGDTVSTGTLYGQLETNGASASAEAAAPTPAAASVPVPVPQAAQTAVVPTQPAVTPTAGIVNENPVTSASLTALAYRIGLDLRRIPGSGSGGRITEEDVIRHIATMQALLDQPPVAAQGASAPSKPKVTLPDFTKWGAISTQKVSTLRQKIAAKMSESWQTVPHVTQYCDADITDLMSLRKKYNPKYQKKDAKLTLTVFVMRAMQKALQEFPHFNATYDEENQTLILKEYYHMGIAVDTENGLIVPVIQNVNSKSLLALSLELNQIAEKARNRTLGVEDLQGSTFTLSNLGGLGVGAFTPIVNTPEVAILGIGTGELKPVKDKNGKIEYRLKMPLCLSYDHRVIDGADGARFVMKIREHLETFDEADLKEMSL